MTNRAVRSEAALVGGEESTRAGRTGLRAGGASRGTLSLLATFLLACCVLGCGQSRDDYMAAFASRLPSGCRTPTPDGLDRNFVMITCATNAQAAAAVPVLASACSELQEVGFAQITIASFEEGPDQVMSVSGGCTFE